MSEPFLGEIRMFGFNYAPRGWALCDGQLLPISQNSGLFSLLGTFYGGDGQSTFALPEMRGRVPVHAGTGPGLSNVPLGQRGGSASTTLTTANLPAHSHVLRCSSDDGSTDEPVGGVLAKAGEDIYASSANANMKSDAIGNTGSGQSFSNMQPYTAVNFAIALQGVFPSRS